MKYMKAYDSEKDSIHLSYSWWKVMRMSTQVGINFGSGLYTCRGGDFDACKHKNLNNERKLVEEAIQIEGKLINGYKSPCKATRLQERHGPKYNRGIMFL